MNTYKKLTKCDFCKYKSPSGCNAKPDSYYCKDALNEFYAYLNKNKQTNTQKPRGKYPWK